MSRTSTSLTTCALLVLTGLTASAQEKRLPPKVEGARVLVIQDKDGQKLYRLNSKVIPERFRALNLQKVDGQPLRLKVEKVELKPQIEVEIESEGKAAPKKSSTTQRTIRRIIRLDKDGQQEEIEIEGNADLKKKLSSTLKAYGITADDHARIMKRLDEINARIAVSREKLDGALKQGATVRKIEFHSKPGARKVAIAATKAKPAPKKATPAKKTSRRGRRRRELDERISKLEAQLGKIQKQLEALNRKLD